MMRFKDGCCVITILVRFASLLVVNGKMYTEKEFQKELRAIDPKISENALRIWSWIAMHESNYNSKTVSTVNKDGSRDYGIFQINSRLWCDAGKESKNICKMSCSELTNDDIADDYKCAQKIYEETQKIPKGNSRKLGTRDGFSAWVSYKKHFQDFEDKARSRSRGEKFLLPIGPPKVPQLSKHTKHVSSIGAPRPVSKPAKEEPLIKVGSSKQAESTSKRQLEKRPLSIGVSNPESKPAKKEPLKEGSSKRAESTGRSAKLNLPKKQLGKRPLSIGVSNTVSKPAHKEHSIQLGSRKTKTPEVSKLVPGPKNSNSKRKPDLSTSRVIRKEANSKEVRRPKGIQSSRVFVHPKSNEGSNRKNTLKGPELSFGSPKSGGNRQNTFKGSKSSFGSPRGSEMRKISITPPKSSLASPKRKAIEINEVKETSFGSLKSSANRQNTFKGPKTSFGSPKSSANRKNVFEGPKASFGSLKSSATRQNTFKGPKTSFSSPKSSANRKNVFERPKASFGSPKSSSSRQSDFEKFKGKRVIKPDDHRRLRRFPPSKVGPKNSRTKSKPFFYPPKNSAPRQTDIKKFKGKRIITRKDLKRPLNIPLPKTEPIPEVDPSRKNRFQRPQSSFRPRTRSNFRQPDFRKFKGKQIIRSKDGRPTRFHSTKVGPKTRVDSSKKDAFKRPSRPHFYPPKRNASRHSDFIKFKRRQRISPKEEPRSRVGTNKQNALKRPKPSSNMKFGKASVFRKAKGMRIINRKKDLRRA